MNASHDYCDQTMAESIIKEIYRNRFEEYYPFHIDLGFQFDMNSWIPIKLVKGNDGNEGRRTTTVAIENYFELIEDGLSDNGLVVITGNTIRTY